jgi:hypothetical protein
VGTGVRGLSGASARASLFMSTPVWGAGHLGLFLRIGLPSLLAPGNLPGLSCRATSRYFIYTRPEDEPALLESPAFRALANVMPVEVLLFEGRSAGPHRLMSDCHVDTMRRADAASAAAVFLPPDCVWSDGSMVRLEAIANSGKSVVHMSGIRLDRDSVEPELSKHVSGGVLSIAPRPLVETGLRHLHPITFSHFWNEHGGEVMPANLIWTVADEGLLLRCFHLHPLLVKSQVPFAKFTSTIDDDLPMHACPDESGDYVVTDSDELVAFELSGRDRVIGTECAKGSIEGVASWAEIGTNHRHRKLIHKAIRLHSTAMTGSLWRAREAESAEIVDAVARLNSLTHRELLKRHPIVLKGRISGIFLAYARRHPAWFSAGTRFEYWLTKLNAALYDRLFLRNGAPRMTHLRWLVRRATLASVQHCLPLSSRTVVFMGSESHWARDIEAERPGLTVRMWPPAASPNASDDLATSAPVDAVVIVDVDEGADVPRGLSAALTQRGTRCFWLVLGNARSLEDYPGAIRKIGGPGTRFANRMWLLTQRHVNGLKTFVKKKTIWPVRKALELAALLLQPLVYVSGAMVGLVVSVIALLLDGVHAAMQGERLSGRAQGAMVHLTRRK